MNSTIGIIGGDLRIIRLAEILAKENYIVYTYALEKNDFQDSNIIKCKTIKELYNNCKSIISGIPFLKDEIYLNTPFSDEKVKISDLLKRLKNKTIFAGQINEKIKLEANKNGVKIIDFLENEELTILNVIPTVEGALQIAMGQTEITIDNSECLVLGFGRIGKLLCRDLKSLGANVSCVARKQSDLAWIQTYGYNGINIKEIDDKLYKYDIIFNTIPALVLGDKELERVNKEVLIIDLASKPGGVDFEKAKELNIKFIHALGLPGKVAPLVAAKYIKQTLDKILNRKEE